MIEIANEGGWGRKKSYSRSSTYVKNNTKIPLTLRIKSVCLKCVYRTQNRAVSSYILMQTSVIFHVFFFNHLIFLSFFLSTFLRTAVRSLFRSVCEGWF